VPVLLKRYLSLNAKIIGFNRDPHFNDSLDGLVLLDLSKVPQTTIEGIRKGGVRGGNRDLWKPPEAGQRPTHSRNMRAGM
jgi:hypothetical protein